MPKIVQSANRVIGIPAIAVALVLALAQPALGHVVVDVGPYHVAIGWSHEPTYVGAENAVEVFVTDANNAPVDDLTPDDLKVVVSNGGQQSDPLALTPSFDEDTGLGTRGDYLAPIIPTSPGDYIFHVTGSIHDTTVDETETSSESTFDAAAGPADIQFPLKLPTVGDIVTRLDRQDSRAAQVTSDVAAAKDAAAKVTGDAAAARESADRALAIGVAVGGVGVLLGLAGMLLGWLAWRRASRVAAPAREG